MALSDFFFGTKNPNPNPSLERKVGEVLCIFSKVRVIILDMDEILSSQDYKEGTSLKRPPVKRILNFVDNGLPLGMGLLKFGNFLYMFGGEHPSVDSSLSERRYKPIVFGLGIHNAEPPFPVFRLDLTNHLSEPVPVRPMLGPKLYAIVEEIGGKIYVLSQRRLSSRLPMFEVLNPMTEEWRTLPSPFEPSGGSRIVYHCVNGTDIVCDILCGTGSYCLWRFSTVTETWKHTKDISSREEMAMCGTFDVKHEDVHLSFLGEDGELWATMPWSKGEDFSSKKLLSSDFEPHVPDFGIISDPVLANTSEQGEYMCALVPYLSEHNDESFALYVFVFQIEKLESEKVPQAQLSVRYLRRQVYDFTDIEWNDKHIPLLLFNKAVIGRLSYNASTGSGECSRGEAKRKRKRKEVDDEDEEGQAVSTHGLP